MKAAALGAAAALLLFVGCDRTVAMDEYDARSFTFEALREAGLRPRGTIRARRDACGPQRVDGWRTSATVPVGSEGTEHVVELCIARRGDRIVSIADAGGIVDDEAFERLEAFRSNPAADRRERTATWMVAAGSLFAGAAVLLTMRLRKERRARRAGSTPEEPFDQDR